MRSRPSQDGLTLIELMIAMTLGLVLIGGAITLFAQVKRSYSENERILRMQDDARFALGELARDLASVSFWAEVGDRGSIVNDASLTLATDCGAAGAPWAYDLADQLSAVDNATGAVAAARYDCIDAAVVQPDSDIIALKRTAGNPMPLPLDPGAVYVRSNGVVAMLFQHPPAVPPAVAVPVPASDWAYVPSIWYVRSHADEGDTADGIPTLCRKRLDDSGVPAMIDECIARGVESLQLEFGLDVDGDGSANRYVDDPTAAQLLRIVTIRASLLVRSVTPQPGYSNEKLYRVANLPDYRPADSYYRRVYTATVNTRNLRNQVRLGLGS